MPTIPTANELALTGGDSSPATVTEVTAKNTAMQAQMDAQKTTAATLEAARVAKIASDLAGEAALPQSLRRGAPVGQPDVPHP